MLFLGHDRQFTDLSGISGLDHPGDSRGFALLDYDRDGWQDIALVNSNAPLFQLYRNQIGSGRADAGRMIAFRLVGGNRTDRASTRWSNRDGVGVRLTVTASGRTWVREHRAGEGLAAQNSATLIVGIGGAERVDSVTVQWPSGTRQTHPMIDAGQLVTAYEDPEHAPEGQPFAIEPYRTSSPIAADGSRQAAPPSVDLGLRPGENARLHAYVTFATWCRPCVRELPALRELRAAFDANQLAIHGVPYDENESPDAVAAWVADNQPPYRVLDELSATQRAVIKHTVIHALRVDILPATLITDSAGRLLVTVPGVPSISELRALVSRSP